MNTINSGYGLTSSSRNAFSGLMSGLDTDSMVKNMLAGIHAKIAKQLQARQLLVWKTDAYRNVTSKLTGFADKFLSYSSPTNALSQSFYASRTITPKGDNAGLISVSGNSATLDNLAIENIISVASSANFITTAPAGNTIITSGVIDFSTAGKTINNLAGETINIRFDGIDYNVTFDRGFSGNDDAAAAAEFNAALARVNVTGGTLADVIEMTDTGDGLELTVKDVGSERVLRVIGGSGQSLAALGISVGSSTSNYGGVPIWGEVEPSKIETQLVYDDVAKGKKITFELNGVRKDIILPEVDDGSPTHEADFVADLQSQFDTQFGAGKITVGMSGGQLTFEAADTTSTLVFVSGEGSTAGFKGVLGLDRMTSNRLDVNAKLSDLNLNGMLAAGGGGKYTITVNGNTLEFEADSTLKQVMDTINSSGSGLKIQYLSTTNRFSVSAGETGSHGRVEIEDAAGGGNLMDLLLGSGYTVNAGKDTVIEISYNGGPATTVTRSTNSVNIDGLNISFNSNAAAEFVAGKPITFETKSNAGELVKNIKAMVEDYNAMIDLVNREVSTKYDRKYPPLTDEQRSVMTEAQIKTWEDQAMTGLLFGDGLLRNLAMDLRFAFTFEVPGYGTASDIGITTSTTYGDNGKIKIDEAKLQRAIEENPDAVAALFTAPRNTASGAPSNDAGIMTRVKEVMDKYANTVGTKKGLLIEQAGIKDTTTAVNNSLYKQIKAIDDKLDSLRYTEKLNSDRYYKQFVALEKYMAQMSDQSSWMMQQFGSGSGQGW